MKNTLIITLTILLNINIIYGQDIYDSIKVDKVWRTYNIHLPKNYKSNSYYPLILGFHGGQQVATSSQGWKLFAYQSKLSEKADSADFIVVYPEGMVLNKNRSWNAGNCCPPAMNLNIDDIGFIDNLLDKLFSNYPIDTTRVYATGSSNGGMLCYRLACELSNRFAAIASNACSQMYFPCNPSNRIPIISFHSKIDPIVPINGGMGGAIPLTTTYFPSQDSILNLWSTKNNCQTRDTIINGNGNDYDYIKIHNCSCNVEIHHYSTTDGSHSWPGGNPNNNPVSTQISATELLWSFFQNYTLSCATNAVKNRYKNQINIYPNPINAKINLQNANGNEYYILMDCLGKPIWQGKNIDNQDFSFLPNGFYLLKINNSNVKLIKE